MEAPEKIYVDNPNHDFWYRTKDKSGVEYTRTDAFIEKAAEWMKLYVLNHDMIDIFEMEDDFKNYMRE